MPTRAFPPTFLMKRRRHFGEAGGGGSRESRIGLGAFEFRSSVFKFPQASLSQFPQHPEKHRTTNPPIKC